jgi:hypothetical protein
VDLEKLYTEISKESGFSKYRVEEICDYILYYGSRLKFLWKTKEETKEFVVNYIGGLH